MAVREIIPDSQVLLVDVRDTLNANGSSCTDYLPSFFDSRAKINQWSFRKPYSTDVHLYKLTDAQIRNLNCGFSVKQIGSYTELPNVMDGGMNGWVYNRPFGGTTSPYREGDYVGYFAKAEPMIRNFNVPATSPNTSGVTIEATAVVGVQDGKSVTLDDIGSLKNAYPAVYVKQVSGSQTRMYKGTSTLAGGTFNVSIPANDLSITGNWDVYPFLELNNTYYTIPNVSKQTINIITSSFSISVTATKATDGSKAINYTIKVKNSGSAVSWTNNVWKLRLNGKTFTDTLDSANGEMSGNLTSPQSIAANTTTTISGTISNINDKMWSQATMVLWVGFQSGNHTQRGVVMSMATP